MGQVHPDFLLCLEAQEHLFHHQYQENQHYPPLLENRVDLFLRMVQLNPVILAAQLVQLLPSHLSLLLVHETQTIHENHGVPLHLLQPLTELVLYFLVDLKDPLHHLFQVLQAVLYLQQCPEFPSLLLDLVLPLGQVNLHFQSVLLVPDPLFHLLFPVLLVYRQIRAIHAPLQPQLLQ